MAVTLTAIQTINATSTEDAIVAEAMSNIDSEYEALCASVLV